METKVCQKEDCGKIFTKGKHDRPSRWLKRKYCSLECHRRIIKEATWNGRINAK